MKSGLARMLDFVSRMLIGRTSRAMMELVDGSEARKGTYGWRPIPIPWRKTIGRVDDVSVVHLRGGRYQ